MSIQPCFAGDSDEARSYRLSMVEWQLQHRGIRASKVLDAFRLIPRHLFCPPEVSLEAAYGDYPLGIGHGQTISQPLMVAEMTALLELQQTARVLEIGTGSGYQAAILAVLAAEVHTVERIAALAEQAKRRFEQFNLTNVHVHTGDGTRGWPEAAPYNAIIVTAASPDVPEPLKQQLCDGGVLAIPVGPRHVQDLVVCRRQAQQFKVERLGGCRFVPLIGEHGWQD